MKKVEIINQLKNKKDIDKLVTQVINNPNQIEVLINTIENEKGSIKFSCEKLLRLVSEKRPDLIYPYFDFYIKLFDIENKFLKWGAIITISNLITVDKENKFIKHFNKYYAPISGPVMVTAANIIGNSWKIAKAKPKLTDKIVNEILKLENAIYANKGEISPECKNIVCGDAIDTFVKIYDQSAKKSNILSFIKKQLQNTRIKVKKKAEKALKLLV